MLTIHKDKSRYLISSSLVARRKAALMSPFPAHHLWHLQFPLIQRPDPLRRTLQKALHAALLGKYLPKPSQPEMQKKTLKSVYMYVRFMTFINLVAALIIVLSKPLGQRYASSVSSWYIKFNK